MPRRTSLDRLRVALLALLACLAPLHKGSAADASAAAQIRQLNDALLSTMKAGHSLGAKGRFDRLKPIIGRTFDIPYMARITVGSAWASASPAEQDQMVSAFGRYVTATYADRFDTYAGQRLEVLDEQPRGANAIVDSRIVKADGTPVSIKYLLHQAADDWRIMDVYLDGTISELATRRSEYSSILQRQGMPGLIASLNRKADLLLAISTN